MSAAIPQLKKKRELTAPFDRSQGNRERKVRKKEVGVVGAGLKPALLARVASFGITGQNNLRKSR
ncbi:MAG: hypothetical protein ACREOR_04315 [Candidatus Binatia bacterium]